MSDHDLRLTDELAGASNILVMEEGQTSTTDHVHEALFSELTEEPADVLVVTFTRPQPWLDAWADRLPTNESNLGLVQLSEMDGREGRHGDAYVRTIDPNDLTGLGMAIRDFFDGVSSNPNPAVVCFDSLTELTEYNSVRTMFRFLRVVTQQVANEDAVAHFHVDPVAHDNRALARLKPPFDAHVERAGGTDEVSVSRPH